MPRLIVTNGVDQGRQFPLQGPMLSIGRDSTSAIRLYDPEVSRFHAQLTCQADVIHLSDLGSANGLTVNGTQVRSADLRLGDRITIGKTTLQLSGDIDLPGAAPLADQVRLLTQPNMDLQSAIVHRLESSEGSRILSNADDMASPWLRTRLGNLNVLYEAVQAVSHILDLDQLLDKVLGLLFQSVEADRACILLRLNADCPLQTKAVRWRDGVGSRDEIVVSKTIIDFAMNRKQGILVADAGLDDRFASGQSVLRYGIREAICVPLSGRHDCVGVLYIDTLRPGRASAPPTFTLDHLALAVAVAHQTALAVEETRYYQALIQSERLSAVGQAIASLSHDIKNLLQGMKSGGEVLKLGIEEKSESAVGAGWRLLEKNQQRLFDLVLDMLSYSKPRDPCLEPTELEIVIRDIVELLKHRAAEREVDLRFDCGKPIHALLDQEGIRRAITNLVTNAIDACEFRADGVVSIECRLDAATQNIVVVIADNGVGITADELPGLFQPFQSTKGERGTGLGLAVSRKIIREHGGDITVTSAFGQGSQFEITLPFHRPQGFADRFKAQN